jgi:hypothetical protein
VRGPAATVVRRCGGHRRRGCARVFIYPPTRRDATEPRATQEEGLRRTTPPKGNLREHRPSRLAAEADNAGAACSDLRLLPDVMGAPVHRLSIKGILWIWSVICSMKCSSQNSCKMSMPDFFLILQFLVCIPDQLNTLDCSVVNISPSIQLSRKEPSFLSKPHFG